MNVGRVINCLRLDSTTLRAGLAVAVLAAFGFAEANAQVVVSQSSSGRGGLLGGLFGGRRSSQQTVAIGGNTAGFGGGFGAGTGAGGIVVQQSNRGGGLFGGRSSQQTIAIGGGGGGFVQPGVGIVRGPVGVGGGYGYHNVGVGGRFFDPRVGVGYGYHTHGVGIGFGGGYQRSYVGVGGGYYQPPAAGFSAPYYADPAPPVTYAPVAAPPPVTYAPVETTTTRYAAVSADPCPAPASYAPRAYYAPAPVGVGAACR